MARAITDLQYDNIKPNPNKPVEKPDPGKPGLYLVVQPSGHKSWVVRYRRLSDRKTRKLTLDGSPRPALARKLAQDALDKIAEGRDPAAEKRAARRAPVATDDIDAAFRLFLDKHVRTRGGKPIRESTKAESARLLGLKREGDKWVETGNGVLSHWKGRKKQEIKPVDVRDLLDEVVKKGPILANRTLTALKTYFHWEVRRDTLGKSPCDGVDNPAPETSRDRVLNDKELAAAWRFAEKKGYPFGSMVQLLILTGCRRDEVREAPPSEFDRAKEQWLIPGKRTKNGRDHLIPITDTMAGVLDKVPRIKGGYVFTTNGRKPISGVHKFKLRMDAAMAKELGHEPPPWTLHDLRRTFVSGLQQLRFPLEVAEACVNHASGTVSGVTAVYARHAYKVEKEEAFEAWARHVTEIVEGRADAKVVSLARAR